MTKKMDLRVRMTQKLLTEALTSLMIHNLYEDLSVVDICETAQVHRTTFYKHFEDKDHLLGCLFDQMTAEVDLRCQNCKESDFHACYVQLCSSWLSYIAENASFFTKGVLNEGNEAVRTVFQAKLVEWLQNHFDAYCQEHKRRFALPMAVIAEYTAGSLIALVIWWLKNNMFVSVNEVISYLDALSGNSILLEA